MKKRNGILLTLMASAYLMQSEACVYDNINFAINNETDEAIQIHAPIILSEVQPYKLKSLVTIQRVIRVYKQILAICLQIISSMLQQHLRHASGTLTDNL